MNKQKMLEVKDSIHNAWWMTKIVAKVLFYQAVVVFVVMGVLYMSNFRVNIVPNIQVISPISTN